MQSNATDDLSDSRIQALKHAMDEALTKAEDFVINPDRLTYTDPLILGRGGFGSVRQGMLDGSRVVAIKQLYSSGDGEDRIKQGIAFVRELGVWVRVDHPHVVPLIGFYWDAAEDTAIFVSPFVEMGTLYRYLQSNNSLSEGERMDLTIDCAGGLAYLHEHSPPICHGDLTSRNILITRDFRAKLCDFGLSSVIEETSAGLATSNFHWKGTARYRSPELHGPGEPRRTLRSDVWAFGCVALEILANREPFFHLKDKQLGPGIMQSTLPADIEALRIPGSWKAFFVRCWEFLPANRPPMVTCLRMLIQERNHLSKTKTLRIIVAPSQGNQQTTLLDTLNKILESLSIAQLNFDTSSFDSWFLPSSSLAKAYVVRQAWGTLQVNDTVRIRSPRGPYGDREDMLDQAIAIARHMKAWDDIKHPHILPLDGFYVHPQYPTPNPLFRIPPQGDLETYMQEPRSQLVKLRLLIDVARGMSHLHSLMPPRAFGSSGPSQIFVTSSGRAALACYSAAQALSTSTPTPILVKGGAEFGAFSPPEIVEGITFNPKGDIWVLGCLLFYALTGQKPYSRADSPNFVIILIAHRQPPALPSDLIGIPDSLRKLIEDCWTRESELRPTIQRCIDVLVEALLELC